QQTVSLQAARRKLVLEAQKIEEIELAAFIAVRVRLACRKRVLEAKEIKEIELAALVAVGVALHAAIGRAPHLQPVEEAARVAVENVADGGRAVAKGHGRGAGAVPRVARARARGYRRHVRPVRLTRLERERLSGCERKLAGA